MSTPNSAITCGSATAIMVELSGASIVASATVITGARSDVRPATASGSSRADADETGVTIPLQDLAVADQLGRRGGPDHGWHTVLARDDGAVAENAAGVGDDRRDCCEQRCP